MQRVLAQGGAPDLQRLSGLLGEYPSDRDEMLKELHGSLGNEYVGHVLDVFAQPVNGDPPAPTSGLARQLAQAPEGDLQLPMLGQVSADSTPQQATPITYVPAARGNAFKGVKAPTTPGTFDPLASAKTLGGQDLSTVQTVKAEADILNEVRHRNRRFEPTALAAAQTKLGVANATGAFNTETLRKLVAAKGAQTADSILDATTWTTYYPGADLFLDYTEVSGSSADRSKTQNADVAAQSVGFKDYKEYAGILKPFTFLGVTGEGTVHPHLQARLSAAEKFLVHRHGTVEQAKLKSGFKGGLVGSYNTSKDDRASGHAHFHTMGLAVDFDKSINPYVYPVNDLKQQRGDAVKAENKGKSDAGDTTTQIDPASAGEAAADWWVDVMDRASQHAAQIFHGQAITRAKMMEWSNTLSTEEMHARIASGSAALKQYYDLTKAGVDADIVAAYVGAGYTNAQAKLALADAKKFPGWFDGGFSRGGAKGVINNQSLDLVVALRDAGGLSWGGSEMSGSDQGDFMHFDCRHDPLGTKLKTHI